MYIGLYILQTPSASYCGCHIYISGPRTLKFGPRIIKGGPRIVKFGPKDHQSATKLLPDRYRVEQHTVRPLQRREREGRAGQGDAARKEDEAGDAGGGLVFVLGGLKMNLELRAS